ncbi:MAG: thymidine phosphorylase [Calditrichaeota bacterium]|nr:thymidine phosphorylase [Calditrichota bacterium]MCB9391493.1 thymidine phosphorylase [Calditrichota bacterium]
MQAAELISRKQLGGELSDGDISQLLSGFVKGSIPDYQMSALLMAIYFRGLSDREGRCFLDEMIKSGDRFDLSSLPGRKVDKHSTGGIGDKTSLIIAPVLAEAGVFVPMISGRALGHTGGTLDKLESIRGVRVTLSESEFVSVLRACGCAFGAQTDSLVPADKKLYALRDVTSTVAIPPLIAASILSKKIAEGTNALVMDVKLGPGGFLESPEQARELAERLVLWSRDHGVETRAFGTDMHEPLGESAGNWLEVAECLRVLRTGDGDPRLLELCGLLGGAMLELGGVASTPEEGKELFLTILRSGAGYSRFKQIAEAQGADPKVWEEFERGSTARNQHALRAASDGFVIDVHPREIGFALVELGAGRKTAQDRIDPAAGIVFQKRRGDSVVRDEPLATLQWNGTPSDADAGLARALRAFEIGTLAPTARPLLYFEIQ